VLILFYFYFFTDKLVFYCLFA